MFGYKTRQQLFDNAWKGFVKQGWKRSAYEQSCRYRGPKGARCAIGWSIPNKNYDQLLEGEVASLHVVRKAANISIEDGDFVYELQKAHEYAYDGDNSSVYVREENPELKGLEERMREFASKYQLTIPGE